jgi:hypothetical protein
MDMGWSDDPFESYRIFQSKVSDIYSKLVQEGRIIRLDATGSVPEVQKRMRTLFNENIDISEMTIIDPSDRLAQNLSQSEFDWLSYTEGGT